MIQKFSKTNTYILQMTKKEPDSIKEWITSINDLQMYVSWKSDIERITNILTICFRKIK